MKSCLITFRSVTPAQRAESVLKRSGVECRVRRTPKWMEAQGCGYSLHLPCSAVQAALELLRTHDVPFRKVYLHRDNGAPEELQL